MNRSLCACLAVTVLIASPAATAAPATASVEIDGHRFTVELAEDDAARARGLMYRETMAPDHGMLFVFPDSAVRTFWMKNTKIALDMLFFDDQRKLVSVQPRVPPCQFDPCPMYPSAGPARYVLELNGGEAGKLGIKPGDELHVQR
ncbi:MAG TPA: DUF192 domain-containing protein [Rhodanobacteraceae bacterium]|nr:DUF192 domain-containing protein [Rhodanobacteraceae bacterium]